MNIDLIFEAAARAGAYLSVEDQRNEKVKQLHEAQARKCGNCYHWMKTSCIPETEHNHFKSCNSTACGDFVLDYTVNLIQEIQDDLKKLDEKLAATRSPT
ncbi:MAG: hypothetical protein ACR2P4_07555 [Gammaproteobacteria bacterium]